MTWTIEKSRQPDIAGNPWRVIATGSDFEISALEFITGERGEHIPIVAATDDQITNWADRCMAYQAGRRR
jgi:hypothetical protein